MAARALRRPAPLVLGAGCLVILLAGAGLAATYLDHPDKSFEILVLALAAASAVFVLPDVDPAYPISLGVATAVFSGNWQYLGIPFGLDRPLLLFGIAGVLVRALPDVRRTRAPEVRPVHWLLLVVGLYAIGSALFAGTLTQHEAFYALLDRLGLIGFLLLFVAPRAFATPRSRDVLLVTLTVLGAYLGLTALFEQLHLTALVFPRYINNPAIGIHYGRARGPFLESAADGLALFTCAVAATIGLAQWSKRPIPRACAAAVVVLCGLGIVFTVTRQIWLGSAIATLLTLVVARPLRRYALPAAAGGALLVLAALAFVPGLSSSASGRADSQSPVWDRLNSDSAILRMIDARPLLGFGWYRFLPVSPAYYRQAAGYPLTAVDRPHNVFLGNIAELGLVGGLAWLAGLLWAIGSGLLRRGPPELDPWRMGLVAVALNWLIVANFTPLGYAFANHMVWLWAGICLVAPAAEALRVTSPDAIEARASAAIA